MAERPSFTGINYDVCLHCTNLVYADTRDEVIFGCGLRQDEAGNYEMLGYKELDIPEVNDGKITNWVHIVDPQTDLIDLREGCDQFVASGLPAHPFPLSEMIQANPLAATIPEDPEALETSWAFDTKMREYNPHRISDYRAIVRKRT